MKPQTFSALICGYGVPKNILEDKNYHAYLTVCFNHLFDKLSDRPGIIVVNGGPTDCYKPYRRTEAGEMTKWLKQKIAEVEKLTKQKIPWQIINKPKSLSSVENLLNCRLFAKEQKIIFCEHARAPRIKKLAAKIFGRDFKIIPVDFDASARRYTPIRTKELEQNFLRMELAAIDNPIALKKIRAFMKEKLAIMRKYPAEQAHRRLPEILEKLHQEFKKKG
jgi:hypothetical protein